MPQSSALARLGSLDVAFALLHGPFGEDGTIQGLFEMMGTRYVGAGVLASAVGMDKHFMKLVLAASGLPVGPFVAITPARVGARPGRLPGGGGGAALPGLRQARPGRLQPRASRGWSEPPTSTAAIEDAQRYDPKVIVEQGFVEARELECGVLAGLDGDARRPAQVAEIRVHSASGFYDFEAKYLPEEQVDLDVPADVGRRDRRRGARLAIRTFEAIGCEGLARVDVFVTRDGAVVVNEINTMPGFTAALDVPADVGGQRPRLSGAGRPADPPGPAASVGCAEPPGPSDTVPVDSRQRGSASTKRRVGDLASS